MHICNKAGSCGEQCKQCSHGKPHPHANRGYCNQIPICYSDQLARGAQQVQCIEVKNNERQGN